MYQNNINKTGGKNKRFNSGIGVVGVGCDVISVLYTVFVLPYRSMLLVKGL